MPTPPPAIVILAVTDLPRSLEFYRAVFGWEPRVETPVFVQLSIPGGPDLGLYQRAGYGLNPGCPVAEIPTGSVGPVELYFLVEDLEAHRDRALASGGTLLSPIARRSWGDEACYLADPDGHLIGLAREGSES